MPRRKNELIQSSPMSTQEVDLRVQPKARRRAPQAEQGSPNRNTPEYHSLTFIRASMADTLGNAPLQLQTSDHEGTTSQTTGTGDAAGPITLPRPAMNILIKATRPRPTHFRKGLLCIDETAFRDGNHSHLISQKTGTADHHQKQNEETATSVQLRRRFAGQHHRQRQWPPLQLARCHIALTRIVGSYDQTSDGGRTICRVQEEDHYGRNWGRKLRVCCRMASPRKDLVMAQETTHTTSLCARAEVESSRGPDSTGAIPISTQTTTQTQTRVRMRCVAAAACVKSANESSVIENVTEIVDALCANLIAMWTTTETLAVAATELIFDDPTYSAGRAAMRISTDEIYPNGT